MITILCTIIALTISGIAAFIVESMSDGKIEMFPVMVFAIIIFILGICASNEANPNITTSNTVTYTYQCQICEEETTTNKEPNILICDECKEKIKNIESENKNYEKEN